MPTRILRFSIVLLAFLIAGWIAAVFRAPLSNQEIPIDLTNDPESRISTGRKLLLSKTNPSSLQLIPGVSDILTDKIVSSKDRILQKAQKLESAESHNALTLVEGIGKKKAKKLSEHLEIK